MSTERATKFEEETLNNPVESSEPPNYKISIVAALVRFLSELKVWHWLWIGIVLMVAFSLNVDVSLP